MKTWMDEQMDAVLDVKKTNKHLDGTVCSVKKKTSMTGLTLRLTFNDYLR